MKDLTLKLILKKGISLSLKTHLKTTKTSYPYASELLFRILYLEIFFQKI